LDFPVVLVENGECVLILPGKLCGNRGENIDWLLRLAVLVLAEEESNAGGCRAQLKDLGDYNTC
jgi:hypothetical protein